MLYLKVLYAMADSELRSVIFHLYADNTVSNRKETSSISHCGIKCFQTEHCMSFTYNLQESGQPCQLLTMLAEQINGVNSVAGALTYERSKLRFKQQYSENSSVCIKTHDMKIVISMFML